MKGRWVSQDGRGAPAPKERTARWEPVETLVFVGSLAPQGPLGGTGSQEPEVTYSET